MTHLRIILLSLLLALTACSSLQKPIPTATTIPITLTPKPSISPSPTKVPTATPLGCLTQPGSILSGAIDTTKPPQLFLIYLPPCYSQDVDQHYPVLYLLHGQTYNDDEWVRLGAPVAADRLIHSGEARPFIIVFPDDRYWNLPPEPGFGDRVLNDVIPYVDSNFRVLADRNYRSIGGLSLGGGWALYLGLTHYFLFGAIGLHSPAIRTEDAPFLSRYLQAIPASRMPRIWIDAGDMDKELGSITQFESLLSALNIPHEWRRYIGDHTEQYWNAHVLEYLQWYTDGWDSTAGGWNSIPDPTPQP